MQERRRMRRFVLKLPCLICVMEPGLSDANDVLRMQTRNISTDGAYLSTESPLPEGTRMNIEMIVRRSLEAGDELAGSCISLRAMVVRTNERGMAVKFDEQYQISRITTLIAHNRAKARWMEMLTQNLGNVAASSQKLRSSAGTGVLQRTMLSAMDDGSKVMPVY